MGLGSGWGLRRKRWCDGGCAVGAPAAGVLIDVYGLTTAIRAIAALTAAAGVTVAVGMCETHPRN
ncbi:hypothetical protein EDD38_5162 [Kitasatospora cineracea]|uniref:Uncharacterized protein n=1 Tax=Kitasatospora cineracea TaxID=88074 RepID=A0A3N4RTR3_9ACTN|nr:hypothetical protein EDD38_5162 [Kitasatospora cineracea]